MVAVSSFYIDDSGTRHPDHKPNLARHNHDWFALGGILIDDEDIESANSQILAFRSRWPLLGDSPLHSYEIRGNNENFKWLGSDKELKRSFLEDLENLLFTLPVIGIACVIDRPGYNHRYREKYGPNRWSLCKTAFDVVVERAAKISIARDRKLRINIEESSRADDRLLKGYYDSLKLNGHAFNQASSLQYNPLNAADHKSVLYDFKKKKKSSKLMQIADIYLWPMCMGGYEEQNRAYTGLLNAGKLADCHLPMEKIAELGIKYSCFDLIERTSKNAKAE